MTVHGAFLTGIIEGFYGRYWSYETRLAYADYLADAGLNTYLYAPKADPVLAQALAGAVATRAAISVEVTGAKVSSARHTLGSRVVAI